MKVNCVSAPTTPEPSTTPVDLEDTISNTSGEEVCASLGTNEPIPRSPSETLSGGSQSDYPSDRQPTPTATSAQETTGREDDLREHPPQDPSSEAAAEIEEDRLRLATIIKYGFAATFRHLGELQRDIERQLEAELGLDLRRQLRIELEEDLRLRLLPKVKADLLAELKAELLHELREGLLTELKAELAHEFDPELATELNPEPAYSGSMARSAQLGARLSEVWMPGLVLEGTLAASFAGCTVLVQQPAVRYPFLDQPQKRRAEDPPPETETAKRSRYEASLWQAPSALSADFIPTAAAAHPAHLPSPLDYGQPFPPPFPTDFSISGPGTDAWRSSVSS